MPTGAQSKRLMGMMSVVSEGVEAGSAKERGGRWAGRAARQVQVGLGF